MKGSERRYKVFTREDIGAIPQLQRLPRTDLELMEAVSAVLPFRVNEYVVEELIDWSAAPDDPIYRLVFPQPGMLLPHHLPEVLDLVRRNASDEEMAPVARRIRLQLNAHPAGQKSLNVPRLNGQLLHGLQHKYRETVLFFPAAGQTCHSYCTYCFRWAQFTADDDFRFEGHETDSLAQYLRHHREVTSVLVTGGDPLVMGTEVLRRYLEPLLDPSLEHVRSIRIGTKSLSYWPYRFMSDSDSDDLLRLFEEIRASGRHLAIMAHVSHPRELETDIAREAVRRVRGTGALIRTQSPVVRGVNDDSDTWGELWRSQVQLGMVPYYMFVARDTGPQHYFKIPLGEALEIYNGAFRQVSGLGRTARGPVMSATPGKVLVDGVTRVAGQEVFVLKFLQGRDPSWVGRTFFARYDPEAAWLDELRPTFGRTEFFFEARFREMKAALETGAETRKPSPWPGMASVRAEELLRPWRRRTRGFTDGSHTESTSPDSH
jgi:KamA family protein